MSDLNIKYEIEFKRMIQETSKIYSFIFTRPAEVVWNPGQHAIFRYLNNRIEGDKGYRIFSLTSIKEEDYIMFSTLIDSNSTEFKQNLLKLKKGDKMTVEDPQGRFYIHDCQTPVLILAEGVGITPIRSFLMSIDYNCKNPNDVEILYYDDAREYAFEDTFKWIEKRYEGVKVNFIEDREEFVEKIDTFAKRVGDRGEYLISGATVNNEFIKDRLLVMNIDNSRINVDNFIGY